MTEQNKPELKPEDKKAITKIYSNILADFYSNTEQIKETYEKKVPGVAKRVNNPAYEAGNGNGNGNEYVDDFPSFYQVEAVHTLLQKKRVLIADEMGLGKTAEALVAKAAIENETGKACKTLVICPNSAKKLWHERIADSEKGYFDAAYTDRLKVVKLDEYTESAIATLKDADIAVVNYDALSFSDKKDFPSNGKSARTTTRNKAKLKNALLEAGFRYVILDEAHNAKNPGSQAYRSRHVKDIADNAEYLALLTGTPIPNNLSDTYMMITLLERKRIENGKEVGYRNAIDVAAAYSKKPSLIRSVLNARMVRREMKDVYKLPELQDEQHEIRLDCNQDAIYRSILENCELEGTYKLQQLRRALLDPILVDPEVVDANPRPLLETAGSAKYAELDKIVAENASKGEKTVIFSPLWREGVTEKLEDRYAAYGALRMDGTNAKERESIRQRFQTDKECSVLIATDVAGEGISLTAANNVIFLDDPYPPGERDQMVARCYRRGQNRPVSVKTLAVPGTVDEGVAEFLDEKRKAIDFVLRGLPLTEQYKLLMSDPQRLQDYYERTPIGQYLYTPEQWAHIYVHRMSMRLAGKDELVKSGNRSFRPLVAAMEGNIGKKYAQKYVIDYEKGFQANLARAYKRIIETIEQTEGKKRKIDIGSAFGVLSRVLEEKDIVNIDINRYHFEQPLAMKDNTNMQADFTSIPFKDASFDIAVCALGLHYASNNGRRSQAIHEANRILRDKGYYIIVENPAFIVNPTAFEEGLKELGFEPIRELTGYVKSTKPDDMGLNAYVIVAKKVARSNAEVDNSLLRMSLDDRSIKRHDKLKGIRKRGIAEEFVFYNPENGKGESLEERVRMYRKKYDA